LKNLIFLCTVHLLEFKIFAYETKLLVSYAILFLDSNFDYSVMLCKGGCIPLEKSPPPRPLERAKISDFLFCVLKKQMGKVGTPHL
jgi:hypothetical protein